MDKDVDEGQAYDARSRVGVGHTPRQAGQQHEEGEEIGE